MKLSKAVAGIFGVLGILAMTVTVWVSFTFRNTNPILLTPAQEARECAIALMDAVQEGNYSGASSLFYGTPDLGMDGEPADTVGVLIWRAFQECFSYEMMGTCYPTANGLAQDVRISFLDIASVTERLKDRTQSLLQTRVEQAENVSQVYDENNEFRESVVLEVLYQAAGEALVQDARQQTVSITVNLVYRDGRWWVLAEDALLEAISGQILR